MSSQVSRILANLDRAVVWVVLILSQITSSTNLLFELWDRLKRTNYNWYRRHPYIPKFFQPYGKIEVFVYHFAFLELFLFSHCGLLERQNLLDKTFLLIMMSSCMINPLLQLVA